MKESDKIVVEGLAYLEKLHKVNPQKPKLGTEILYNFVCIGIENVLTGVLMRHDCTVDHSGILQLVRELDKIDKVDLDWIEKARFMNKFQSYCSLDYIKPKIPTTDDLAVMIEFGKSIEAYGKKNI